MIKIRDWDIHFEKDRTKQWKTLQWVPVPNKQGVGYKKIMAQKNGLEIFACWIALVEVASTCIPRGNLSKYTIEDLSIMTIIDIDKLKNAAIFLSTSLNWLEINSLDIPVKNLDVDGQRNCDSSPILFNSIQFYSLNPLTNTMDNQGAANGSGKNDQRVPGEREADNNRQDQNAESAEGAELLLEHGDVLRKCKKTPYLVIDERIEQAFTEYCKSRKNKPTEHAKKLILDRLNKWYPGDFNRQIECLNQSIQNGWQGIFEIKDLINGNRTGRHYQKSNGQRTGRIITDLEQSEIDAGLLTLDGVRSAGEAPIF